PGAQTTVRAIASRCLSEPGVLVSVLELLALSRDPVITASDPGTGPLGTRLAENVPPLTTEAPLLLAQGADDTLITTEIQEEFVDAVCDAGQQLDYRTYERRDHVGLVQPDSPLVPDLIAWTHDRFADVPVEPGCLRFGERPCASPHLAWAACPSRTTTLAPTTRPPTWWVGRSRAGRRQAPSRAGRSRPPPSRAHRSRPLPSRAHRSRP